MVDELGVKQERERADPSDVMDGESRYGAKDLCCTEEQLRTAVVAAEMSAEIATQYSRD